MADDDDDFQARRKSLLRKAGTIFIDGDPIHPPSAPCDCGCAQLHALARDRIVDMVYEWICTECGKEQGPIVVPWETRPSDADLRDNGFEVVS
jgi:hypothetical protein